MNYDKYHLTKEMHRYVSRWLSGYVSSHAALGLCGGATGHFRKIGVQGNWSGGPAGHSSRSGDQRQLPAQPIGRLALGAMTRI